MTKPKKRSSELDQVLRCKQLVSIGRRFTLKKITGADTQQLAQMRIDFGI
jgi:hypothetical protein